MTLVNYEHLVDGEISWNWSENQQMGLGLPSSRRDYQLVKMVGNVVFDDVDFSYDDKNKSIMESNLYRG